MIDYEVLKSKPSIGGSQLRAVNAMLEGLESINKDPESPLHDKLTKYTKAIRIIKERSNHTRKPEIVQSVKNALVDLADFKDFLASGEGDTVYQTLIDEGRKHDMTAEELDTGLKMFSDFVEMGLDLDEIKKKQQALDSEKEALEGPDANAPLTDVVRFDKKVQRGLTFANKKSESKSVNDLVDILRDAELSLSEKQDKFEKRNKNRKNIPAEETEKNAENNNLCEQIKKYREAIRILNGAGAQGDLSSEEMRQSALNTLTGFQGFLQDGLEQTNLKRILKEAEDINKRRNPQTAEENFAKGMQALEGTLHFGLDAQKASEVTPENRKIFEEREAEKKRLQQQKEAIEKAKRDFRGADKWINGWKAELGSKTQKPGDRKEYLRTMFTKIMAARLLVNSERGSLSTLNRPVSRYDIEEKTKELMERPGHFKDFMDKVMSDEKLLAKASKAAGTGHGGGLDDMLKSYLKELPAGKLSSDPLIDRYMPTAKERIEALQDQAKVIRKKGSVPYEQAVEIIAIRNRVDAERKNKSSLDIKIPTGGKDLAKEVTDMSKHHALIAAVSDDKTMDLLVSGHGGEMVTNIRGKLKENYGLKREADLTEAERFVREGTFVGRGAANRDKAQQLKEKLEQLQKQRDADPEVIADTGKAARELIAESIALCDYRKKKGLGEHENIPWKKVRKLRDEIMDNSDMNNTLYPKSRYDVKDICERLDQLNKTQDPMEFFEKVGKEVKKHVTDKKNDEKLEKIRKEKAAKGQGEIGEDEFNQMAAQVDQAIKKMNKKSAGKSRF